MVTSLPSLSHVPVVCQVLPDAFPVRGWLAACAEMDARNARQAEGRIVVPGLVLREQVTYPDLHNVTACAWVYLAHCGRLVARQAGAGTGILLPQHCRGMHPLLAALMHPGDRYTWVYALPEPVPDWPVPAAWLGTAARWGWVRLGAPATEAPQWFGKEEV